MKHSRPKIPVEKSKSDKFINAVTWILLVVLWILPVLFYQDLPQQIPRHFNSNATADDYDSKKTIFFLPAIATLAAFLLTLLNKHPHKFSYLVSITADNAAFQYRNAMRMVRFLRLSIVLVFLILLIFTLLMSTGRINDPGAGLLIVFILLVQFPGFYFLYKSIKRR